jgi:hypothetical protein
MADIFIHDSYLPSLLDFLFAIKSIDGDVSSRPPMNQKVWGFSQKSMTRTPTWKNVSKILSFLTQSDEASQASQTT